MNYLLGIIFILILQYNTNATDFDGSIEHYSYSTLGLLKLLDLEQEFARNLNNYTDLLTEKVATLKLYINSIEHSSTDNQSELEEYIFNPINAFSLMRRSYQDMPKWHLFAKTAVGLHEIEALENLLIKAPDEVDMNNTLEGIQRIEEIYGLKPHDIVNGRLQDKQYDIQFSIEDCLALGHNRYKQHDYQGAASWYFPILSQKYELSNEYFSNRQINKHIFYAKARFAQELSKTITNNSVIETLLDQIFEQFQTHNLAEISDKMKTKEENIPRKLNLYQIGCRGGIYPKPTNLSCYYSYGTTSFLKLAPLKVEEIQHDPYIVMYHNVFSDIEIDIMSWKNVQNPKTSTESKVIERVHAINDFMKRISERITDMTGFSINYIGQRLISNLELGSQFLLHFDFYPNGNDSNEIASEGEHSGTILFYGENVKQGGNLIFPHSQVMVFWLNIYNNGITDLSTEYAICPTIVSLHWTDPLEGKSTESKIAISLEDYDETKERYSSSVLGLLKLYELEQEYIKKLEIYAVRNNTLQIYLYSMLEFHIESHREREDYVSNIFNAFTLIRRTHQDWPKWQQFLTTILNENEMTELNEIFTRAPDKQDMKEMQQNLLNVEKINNLHALDIVRGRLMNKQLDFKLSIRDCMAIGGYKYEIGDYPRAFMWYHSAIKYATEPNGNQFNEILGDPQESLKQLYARSIYTQSLTLVSSYIDIEEILDTVNKHTNNAPPDELELLVNQFMNYSDEMIIESMTSYQEAPSITDLGCRDLFGRHTKLVCRYNFTTSPFLRLAPLKLEEVNIDPYMVIYHDVLSDSDINQMKIEITNTHISNAWTEGSKKNQTEIRKVIGRLAWLRERSNFMDRINQRIMDMTGFSMIGIESLQVANFGPGSYFRPHYDYMAEGYEPPNIIILGDRLASIIFYASDVILGGATVFPRLNVTVTPKKGTSLFWYNTFDDGTHDPRSQHAVCPTIAGSRWTITKWLHLFPQMFLKPCSLRK